MVNSNPETVSTDYDTADLLFFEPLTHEDVLNICDRLNGRHSLRTPAGLLQGVIVQFGGQTRLKLALPLERAGVKIIGTSPDSIDLAEDRERFSELLKQLSKKENTRFFLYDAGTPDAFMMCGCCPRYWVTSSRAASSAAARSSSSEQTTSCGRSMSSIDRPALDAPSSRWCIASALYAGDTR